ncbi:MAG: transcriptional repressor LexA [Sporomusaceae bacterium]|nr:transcriptional repressor LexA [Sporomusaceae bacterium]
MHGQTIKEGLLTNRQKLILSYIRKSVREKGYPPSVREIGEAVGLSSSSTVHSHLIKLQELGFIRRDPTKPRALELTEDNSWRQKKVIPVPLVGRVTAGEPIFADENIEETYPIPNALLRNNENVFMLTVQGESMINAGILDGDYIIVREQSFADNHDIVVALLDGEAATVKRFFKEKNRIRLQPENDAMEPIYADSVQILGKVIGVYRQI